MNDAQYIYDCTPHFVHFDYKFTGKERDSESGLDYFGARYYASNVGRWISADWAQKPEAVPYSKLDDPQSLNLYEYVGNNPLSTADEDGHCDWCWNVVARVSTWVATHPAVGEALGHIGDGTGGTLRGGVGATTPKIDGVPNTGGELSGTAYVKGTSSEGLSVGVDVKASGSAVGVGVERTTNFPL